MKPVVIHVLPPSHPALNEALDGHVEIRVASRAEPSVLIEEGKGAHALIARMVDLPFIIGAEVFDALPSLRIVTAIGSGADCYDIDAASERGIPVLHNPGIAATPVAEYVLGCIPLLVKRMLVHSDYLRGGGDWYDRRRFVGEEVKGKTLGVLGLGAIGAEVAIRARAAFDVAVIAHDPAVPPARFAETGVRRVESLADLLAEVDILSLHVPLLSSTRGIIDAPELALMKPGAILINASRGAIVNEHSLTAALQSGRLGGAAVDVFDPEPPTRDNPLLSMPNVLATPHSAGVSAEGIGRLARATGVNLIKALRGERPPHIVNPDAWPPRRT